MRLVRGHERGKRFSLVDWGIVAVCIVQYLTLPCCIPALTSGPVSDTWEEAGLARDERVSEQGALCARSGSHATPCAAIVPALLFFL